LVNYLKQPSIKNTRPGNTTLLNAKLLSTLKNKLNENLDTPPNFDQTDTSVKTTENQKNFREVMQS
jgi:hypothetical protein